MSEVEVDGFVDEIRDLGGLKFIKIYSKNGYVQVTVNKKTTEAKLMKEFDELTRQSCVRITGEEKKNEKAPNGIEVIPKKLHVYSMAAVPLPLEPTGKTPAEFDTRFKWRFLDLRDEKKRLIFQIQTAFEHYAREYFLSNNFIEIHSPKLIGAPSESGAQVFALPYFGREAFLAQSPQFYKQMAICAGFNKVFEIAPVFRAEQSNTFRHFTEFISLDVEMGYVSSYDDVIEFEEGWLKYIIKNIKENWGDTIKEKFGVEVNVPKTPFPRIKMQDAYDIVEKEGGKVTRGEDLDSDGEKIIGKYAKEKLKSDYVYITDFPVSVRPFYHMRQPKNPKLTFSTDLLMDGLEITTLAQREHRYDILSKQAVEKGLPMHSVQFYLDFFKYGAPTQAGFGFGVARFLMKLLGFNNIREVTFIPRDPKTLFP